MMNQKGRSDLPEYRANATFLFNDVYKNSTRGEKKQADARQYGRSMVEMLGVLAIIGVLSVGGIAGYNKAMFKYKLNKQAQQLNQVINSVAINARNFNDLSSTESISLFPYLIKLGDIPTDMIDIKRSPNLTAIYDIFGNSLVAQMQPAGIDSSKSIPGVTSLFIYANLSDSQSLHICKNIFEIIKENSSNIYYIYTATGYNTDDSRTSSLFGDNYCTGNKKCLKNLSLQSIEQECTMHWGNKQGHFVVLWKL